MANAGGTTNLGLAKDPGVSVRVWRALDTLDSKVNQSMGLTGAVATTRYVGGHATTAPTTGTFVAGDFVITKTGKIFICTVAGSPGTWVNAGITDQGAPLGLTGAAETTRYVGATASGAPGSGTFVLGDLAISQAGTAYVCTVAGTPGTWVEIGSGTATNAINNAKGQPATVTGSTSAARFAGGTTTGAPVAGAHSMGDLVIAQDGVLWVCTTAGTPGTWAAATGPGAAYLPLAGGEVTGAFTASGATATISSATTLLSGTSTEISGTLKISGPVKISNHAVPADGAIAAGEAFLYFDQTDGAAALNIKAKQADGTVKTATIAVVT